MTLTSFIDVKAEPCKSEEAKLDLLKKIGGNIDSVIVNTYETDTNPQQTVEYVELYNHTLARRRRLCRALAWLLAVFLLLDIGVVLYIGLRMRHAEEPERAATLTCRLRFRSATGSQVERTEVITASSKQVLVQPMWAAEGQPAVLHDFNRGFSLLRAPSARLCFIKHVRRNDQWFSNVLQWARESHEVRQEHIRFVRLAPKLPAISPETLRSYGNAAWNMCHRYRTFLVEPVIIEEHECPVFKCKACPGGAYLRDSTTGCQTCLCAQDFFSPRRNKRSADKHRVAAAAAAVGRPQTLTLDEGVLPEENGDAVNTIDVISFA